MNTLWRESAQSETRASRANPARRGDAVASPLSGAASATSAGSSNGSRSISLITFDNRSSAGRLGRRRQALGNRVGALAEPRRAARHVHDGRCRRRASRCRRSCRMRTRPRTTSPSRATTTAERRQRGRLLRPCDQTVGMHRSPALPALTTAMRSRRSIRRAQRGDARLALADLGNRRRLQQPPGQPLLAHRRAARRQQLKQAARTEHVEVVGIGMIGDREIASPLGVVAASTDLRCAPRRRR